MNFRGNNTKEYWEKKHCQLYEVSKEFNYSGMTDNSYFKVAADIIFENQNEIKRKSILDIGCAVGKSLNYFSNRLPGFELNGYDFSSTAIEAAKLKTPTAKFECRDLLLSPINQDFGIITMFETIEHIEEGNNYSILNNILDHCEYAIISTVDTEDDCFGEHISHYKIDTFNKKGYNVLWSSYLDEINMPTGIFHYMIFLIKGKLNT